MKKLILMTVLLGGLSTSMYAQGTVQFDTTGGGLVYFGPTTTNPVAVNINGELLGGTPFTSLASLTGANSLTPVDFGVVANGNGASYQVPGTPVGTVASLQVRLWDGNAAGYAAAVAAGAQTADSGLFNNPTGGAGAPPGAPTTLTGMPSLHLLGPAIPEPSMIALGCLGAVSLMVFRRRN